MSLARKNLNKHKDVNKYIYNFNPAISNKEDAKDQTLSIANKSVLSNHIHTSIIDNYSNRFEIQEQQIILLTQEIEELKREIKHIKVCNNILFD